MECLETCHLCYSEFTPFILTYPSRSSEACLPVCSRCVPPWINGPHDGWWYEKRTGTRAQRQPTTIEVSVAMGHRYAQTVPLPIDRALRDRCEARQYRAKFKVDELLQHWNERRRIYEFFSDH